jgi:hypothetical protein
MKVLRRIHQLLCLHSGTYTETETWMEGRVQVTEAVVRECSDCGKNLHTAARRRFGDNQ